MPCSLRGKRRPRHPLQVRRLAAAKDEAEAAEEQLAALEAEMEALEDAMEGSQQELEARVEKSLSSLPAERTSSVMTSRGASAKSIGRIAVCGSSREGNPATILLARLREEVAKDMKPVWVDLAEASKMSFEDLDEQLERCTAVVFCPDPADASPENLEAAQKGLKAVLASAPPELTKAVLLSHLGAQQDKGGFNMGAFFGGSGGTSWADVEDALTSTSRLRSANKPLWTNIVRVCDPPSGTKPECTEVRCLRADNEDTVSSGAYTCPGTAAEAVFQALRLEVTSNFVLAEMPAPSPTKTEWDELLLPFVGPELWRREVQDTTKAVFFVQGWADEFFGPGKSAMRMGVKTPVMLRNTPSGVSFKFRPLGTPTDDSFDDLEEGGVEFIVEEPAVGSPRLRIRRCGYGWKVTVKENSEKALLDKFKRDWAEVTEKKAI